MSFEAMVADTLRYIEQNRRDENQSITLLGHSMGGKTAMLLSLLHPSIVEKLVVVDIAPVHYEVIYICDINHVLAQQSLTCTKTTTKTKRKFRCI
jgi:pimeloyl-ACP methyl ester carboxylesterase